MPDLPLLPAGHNTARSALTCEYRCGNACSHEAPNRSLNTYFGDVVQRALSRRGALKGGAVLALAAGGTALAATPAAAAPALASGGRPPRGLDFEPVAPNTADAVTIPDGYAQQIVIRWGDPVLPGAPRFDARTQSVKAQAGQFGYNNDYMALLDLPHRRGHKLLVVNHEYTNEEIMFYGYDPANPTRDQVEIAWAAHGLTVLVVREDGRSGRLWPVVGDILNRRLTATTPFTFTGPAAGSDLLKTSADPTGRTVLGTLNNCGGGVTPWGTVLSGEENFNQYFANAAAVADPVAKARLARYGLPTGASQRKWERYDDRFDIAKEPNEPNRHGWVVEIDPHDPHSVPRKRTALGRFKHEAAEPRLTSDGRVALYMGDDERFDYLYKYVSKHAYKKGHSRAAREHNMRLLDEGTLYVAKFTGDSPAAEIDGTGKLPADGEFDGGGEWIPLASGSVSHVPGMSAEEVYVFTRLAADKVGATKMDRPEDVEPHPYTGRVYVALTNNKDRGATGKAGPDEANPRTGNKHGHILELEERHSDAAAKTFHWKLMLVCGDPDDPSTYFAGFDKNQVSPISCPDNVAFDEYGNLWIATDGAALGYHDGLFAVPLKGSQRGHVQQFLTMPKGAECCGPIITKDRILVAPQHPGETDGATAENPGSTWPDGPDSLPRPSVVTVWNNKRHH
ncbi:PhoX family phosphatase [Streptomyces bobili]|uniref:PhoX family protein n=1 Tax=Streptomyces bobili TaxID=67280 RepID=UPI00224E1CBA|nr:PhoX family phosphatase [Streptomyces bobili]MCX5527291.1 PhoX family phosphatase [Streptomyces bobili]